jgi:tRNA-5-methyluridine54 2-sulfurtransferase
VDLLQRQSPLLPAGPGFSRKAKPFCRFYERETAAYALLRGIEFIEDECPFSEGSKQLEYKAILNKIEEQHPGTKINFYAGFQNARTQFLAPTAIEIAPDAQPVCPNCGQMTTRQGLCAFCQIFTNDLS